MDISQNLNNLMKEAQKMQQRMQNTQEQLTKVQVCGESGGGKVKIYMNGKHEALKVELAAELLDQDHVIIQELIAAAINSATQEIENESRKKINELAAGINFNDLALKDGKE